MPSIHLVLCEFGISFVSVFSVCGSYSAFDSAFLLLGVEIKGGVVWLFFSVLGVLQLLPAQLQ